MGHLFRSMATTTWYPNRSWKGAASTNIALPNTASLNLANAFTIEGYINLDVSGNTGTRIFFSKAGAQYQYQAELTGTTMAFYLMAGATSTTFYSVSRTVSTGSWLWFAARADVPNGKLCLSLGTVANQHLRTDLTGTHFTTTNSGVINNSSNPVLGMFDEFRYWNTYRTDAELNTTIGKSLTGTEAGLVAYYKMNNNTNNSCTNTGSANNGTNNFGTYSTDVAPVV